MFFVDAPAQLQALQSSDDIPDWVVTVQGLIHARSPSAFDEQIALTVDRFAGGDWEALQRLDRPEWVRRRPTKA